MSEFELSLIGFNCDSPDSLSVASGTLKMLTKGNDSSVFIIYSISLSSHTKFLFYVYFMLTVAPGGNNLATICYKDFLGLATINMYYYYYYYYQRR